MYSNNKKFPTMEIVSGFKKDVKPCVQILIHNADYDYAFKTLIESVGFTESNMLTGSWIIYCFDVDELERARSVVNKYFDNDGDWWFGC